MIMRREVVAAIAVVAATSIAVMVMVIRKRNKKRDTEKRKQCLAILGDFAKECATPVPLLWSVAHDLASSLRARFSPQSIDPTDHDSPLPAVVSYIAPLPTGEEKGWFYGASVRDTSLLILSAQLRGKNEPISHVNRVELPIPSSAIDETSKEAKEMVDGINKALDKHGLNMQVFSILDDTVGDLASGRYYNRDSIVAVNLGMGTNAAYMEQAEAVGISSTSGELVVNVDWGGFKSSHLPLTEYDKCLDSESLNPGCRIFEKLVSGKYLGEIVRKVLLKMAQQAALFGHKVPPKLARPNLLRPIDLAAMHQDTSDEREVIDDKLREIFDIWDSTPLARELVAEVCDIVTERGARLAGAGIVGIMKKLERIKKKKSVVIVQGTLYEDYRVFRNYLHSSVWEMLELELSNNVVIQPCHAGSGAGPLFLAASQSSIS